MDLQDHIDQFQKAVFGSLRHALNNECRIAALVPLVEESYGIYKFVTSMLRAMHKSKFDMTWTMIHYSYDPYCLATGAVDALQPLRQRYNAQHYGLLQFYHECSNLRYLTSLINVPKLPQDPPSLMEMSTPPLPKRPTPAPAAQTPPPAQPSPEPVIDFWSQQQEEERRKYEQEQQRLAKLREQEQERARQQQLEQQRQFEEQQRMLAERERQQQQELLRQQMQGQQASRINDLEMQLLNLQNQLERDQIMLQQYDQVFMKERMYIHFIHIRIGLESQIFGTRNGANQSAFSTTGRIKG